MSENQVSRKQDASSWLATDSFDFVALAEDGRNGLANLHFSDAAVLWMEDL
jgi:hypothetical protein